MKKKFLLFFVLIFAVVFVGCSAYGKVESAIEEQQYVYMDMDNIGDEINIENITKKAIKGNYLIVKNAFSTSKAKVHVWAKFPTSIYQVSNVNWTAVVEFDSEEALKNEWRENEDFRDLARDVLPNSTNLYGELAEKGAIIDNCFIYAKGPLADTIYVAMVSIK